MMVSNTKTLSHSAIFGNMMHILSVLMYTPKEGILNEKNLIDNFIEYAEDLEDNELISKISKIKQFLNEESEEDIVTDHAQLMVGPFELSAPPYGSVYLEKNRKIMGDTTMEVGQFYFDSGLEVASDYNDPPDHIAVEMEFIHFLFSEIFNSLNEDKVEDAENYKTKLREFLKKYYLPFSENFAEKIKDNAETNVYKITGDAILHINKLLKEF
ncbi:TorD/DmsD family molecular chaperone [Flexistipes sp.]|uniref:TorD/DmsD family molecular chaperone n=1 Tax=Flexistipes sp. TaxID=3088135 RepID=UPI002E233DF7